MSDYTDAVLDGEHCESCGEWLGAGCGYARRCVACGGAAEVAEMEREVHATKEPWQHPNGRWKTTCSCGKTIMSATAEKVREYALSHVTAYNKEAP